MYILSSLSYEYCQTDLRETKGSRVKLVGQDYLVFLGKKDHLVTKERRAMEAFLAFLELRVFGERGAVLELLASPVQRDRKENPLL